MVAPAELVKNPSRHAEGHAPRARPADRREKQFARLIVQGFPQWKAYQAISGAKIKETCERQGVRWFARLSVQGEIARQRAAMTEESAATRAEKRNHLARVMRAEDTPPSVIVSAVAVDNRMTGDDEPFRKAAGDDLRVQFFVLRLDGNAAGAAALPEHAGSAHEPINVTPSGPTGTMGVEG